MGECVIRADRLGKRYRLGEHVGRRAVTLRESLAATAARLFGMAPQGPNREASEAKWIWALRDAAFEVNSGEAVGIVGGNGAGKSTLLKVLARITEPTTGRAEIRGRVGSLLEVGTGFHLELTGRENIYLSGAILGMRRAELCRKFDEIVAFSGVEKFLDTPVKHYSSGMYVRLAFAVAAHLEPEILLVDEVLAVGDAAFQKKCLGKMDAVTREGRAVLFVSHNMPAVQRLCSRCLWLDQGRVVADGSAGEVIGRYLRTSAGSSAEAELPPDAARAMRLRRVHVSDGGGGPPGVVEFSRPVVVEVDYDVNQPVSSSHVAVFIHDGDGVCVLGSGDADLEPARLGRRQPGRYRGAFKIPPSLLGEGTYTLTVTMGVPYVEVFDRHDGILQFQIIDETSARRQFQHSRRPGVLGLELPWSVEERQ